MSSSRVQFILVVWFAFHVSATAQEWNQFGGSEYFRSSSVPGFNPGEKLQLSWSRQLGEGMSGLVTDGTTAYTMALVYQDKAKKTIRQKIVAMDLETGKIRWERVDSSLWNDAQESFGGRKRAPQATPAIINDTLVTIGFSGKIHGLNRHNGSVLWTQDAVGDLGATPVQFGFSASPVPLENHVLVLIGGKSGGGKGGGLLCLDASTGELVWNVPCGEASYATPVVWRHSEGTQIVFQDRNQLKGVAAESGKVLWSFNHPKPGLTNVPTPLPVSSTAIVVSGQGFGGTKRLEVNLKNNSWSVEEEWHNRTQFFYCNWVYHQGQIMGCDDKLMSVIDAENGRTLAKWRGYGDGNLVATSDSIWALDGRGKMTCLKNLNQKWTAVARVPLTKERSWTPPTMVGRRILCRAGSTIFCFSRSEGSGPNRKSDFEWKLVNQELARKADSSQPDLLGRIVEAFEQMGPAKAVQKYGEIRQEYRQQFGLDKRAELMKLAATQGYYQIARQIVKDARADFKNEDQTTELQRDLEKLLRQPSADLTQGKDGITRVEFAIRNRGGKQIELYVRGPDSNRFSYGIPMPPGKFRIMKWPVGTRLFYAVDDRPEELIFTLDGSFAGETRDLKSREKE